jgi:uncharacterized protein YjbJ (UPF0337 family)
MKGKFEKLKGKLKDKKDVIKQASNSRKDNVKNFFQACGIRMINY